MTHARLRSDLCLALQILATASHISLYESYLGNNILQPAFFNHSMLLLLLSIITRCSTLFSRLFDKYPKQCSSVNEFSPVQAVVHTDFHGYHTVFELTVFLHLCPSLLECDLWSFYPQRKNIKHDVQEKLSKCFFPPAM